MNTWVRSYAWTAEAAFAFKMSRETVAIILLSISIFLTAIGVVYIKDFNRRLFIRYQFELSLQQEERVQWSRLLFQQSQLARQDRIESIASSKWGMVLPDPKSVTVIRFTNHLQ